MGYYRTYERWDYAPEGTGIGGAIYLVIGVIVALARDYFDRLVSLAGFLEAVLAVLLWPLLLFGIDIRLT